MTLELASVDAGPRPKILLIEDGKFDRRWLSSVLAEAGFEVLTAERAEEALDILKAHAIEVVVCDVVLPEQSGLELARQMRQQLPVTPVVLMTASQHLGNAVEAVKAQAFDFLLKPVSPENLVSSVRTAVRERAKRWSRAKQVDELEHGIADAVSLNSNIVESLSSGLLVVDEAGLIVLFNGAAEECLGLSRQELLSRDYRTAGELGDLRSVVTSAFEGADANGQKMLEFARSDGRQILLGYTVNRLRLGKNGERRGVIVHFSDISAKVRQETAMIQADRLAMLGTMAGALAHEINNPMTVIVGRLEQILQDLEPAQSALAQQLRLLERSVWSCVDIVRAFLTVARPRKGNKAPVHVTDALQELTTLIGTSLATSNVRLVQSLQPSLPPLDVDASKLQQILLNLILNAKDAMPRGGLLTIRGTSEADQVALEIQDEGTGIAPDVAPHIFEMFFTTKEPGRGTGLGLAICKTLVTDMGGQLLVRSRLGEGTTFTLKLPKAKDSQAGTPRDSASLLAPPRSLDLDVLLVDDETSILETLSKLLERDGCRVVCFADPVQAVEQFSAGRYDLAILDIRMPKMDGMTVARRLHRIEPTLPVLFASGLLPCELEPHEPDANVLGLLNKPFSFRTLSDWLDQVARTVRKPKANATS